MMAIVKGTVDFNSERTEITEKTEESERWRMRG